MNIYHFALVAVPHHSEAILYIRERRGVVFGQPRK